MSKNTLYISYDGMTDSLGQSQVLPYLGGLAAHGYKVTLISAEKPEKFILLSHEIRKICDENKIEWHPVSYTKKPAVLSTLFNIWVITRKALRLNRKKKFILTHCRSYIPGLIGLHLKNKHKIPFLFDMRGFWVDEKVDGNIWNLNNPIFKLIYNYMKRREKQLFSEADKIISLTHTACPLIHQIAGDVTKKISITVIPCCVDVHHFNPKNVSAKAQQKWISKLGLKESDYILTYLGSLSTWYLPLEMLKFYKRLLTRIPEAKFLIITQEDPAIFIEMVKNTGINTNNLLFTSSGRNELPALLSLSDASVFFIKPSFSKIASSPTKLGELLSMGIPVICNTGIGDTDELIRKSGTGVICHAFNEEAYDETIQQFALLQKSLSGEQLREKAIELFSLEKGVSDYLSVYENLLHQA
jgi:glycosyltransferase involved in cell wall biosynthesis